MKYCTYFLIDPETQMPFYVGSGITKIRPYQHFDLSSLNKNTYKNNKIKKLLTNGFTKEQIADIFYLNNNRQECLDLEQMYIDLLCCKNYGGILSNIAKNTQSPFLGLKHSEYTKQKISKSHIGIKPSEETLKKLIGRTLSDEHKTNLSKSLTGRKAHNLGKKMTEEQKRKISLKLNGVKLSEETKKKMSEGQKIYWAKKKAQDFLDLGLSI